MSEVNDYQKNAYFIGAACSLKNKSDMTVYDFNEISEKTIRPCASLPPLLAENREKSGKLCAYCQIAKAAVSIRHYFDNKMIDSVNERIDILNESNRDKYLHESYTDTMSIGASEYFKEKVKDFFADASERFADEDLSYKALFWLQGENDGNMNKEVYKIYLSVLFDTVKKLGIKTFLCIRVGYWGNPNISNIMLAQEEFCQETDNAVMISRAVSFMPFKGQNELQWFTKEVPEKYRDCRDSFKGYSNQHINEKGMSVLAENVSHNLNKMFSSGEKIHLRKEYVSALYKIKKHKI